MNETMILMLACAAGGFLGAVFFGGLWWTVRKGISRRQPGLWFLGSFLLRTGITLGGLFFVAQGHLDRLLVCLLGWLIARLVVMRFTRMTGTSSYSAQDASHAP